VLACVCENDRSINNFNIKINLETKKHFLRYFYIILANFIFMIISSQIYFIYKEILGSKGGGVGNPLGWGPELFFKIIFLIHYFIILENEAS
jgi:hypothetical protein